MSESWARIRADIVVFDWKDKLKEQGVTFNGELGGVDDLTDLIEGALNEAIEEGKKHNA